MKQSSATRTVDFLERLAGKAFGAQSAIAPRLPSLFEARPDVGVIRETDDDAQLAQSLTRQSRGSQEETPTTENLHQDAKQRRSPDHRSVEPVTPRRAAVAPDDGNSQVKGAEGTPVPVATLLPAHAPTEVPENPAPQQVTPIATDVTTPAGERRLAPRSNVVITADDPALPTRPALVATEALVIPRVEGDLHAARKIPREQPGKTPDERKAGKEPGALVPQRPASPLPRVGPVVVPDNAMHPRREDPRTALPQAPQVPVVNVTIGRVEIRAVPASPSRPRVAPPKAKPLGLDEYLKQRGGGQ